jgi:electron transfer flavoprotein beta subunit
LKFLIPVKRVPDPYGKIRLTANGQIDESDIKWVINPFDEIAIEEAVRQREAGADIEIVAVTIGGEECEEQLRAALAMGSDRAIHVLDSDPIDSSGVAALLAKICKTESPDIVLMGKQAIDDDSNQAGQMLAGLLDWPQATFISRLTLVSNGVECEVEREVDAGRETLRLTLPAVITTDLRLNEPRYVALPAIIRARSKPIKQVTPSELGGRPPLRVKTVSQAPPPPRAAGRKVGSVDELIDALKNEARVL